MKIRISNLSPPKTAPSGARLPIAADGLLPRGSKIGYLSVCGFQNLLGSTSATCRPAPSVRGWSEAFAPLGRGVAFIVQGKSEAGFTLLEVVVALAIVGLGIVTLLEIFSQGLRLGARSFARTEAVSYSRQVMDNLWARREMPSGSQEGSIGGGYRWRLDVKPLPDEDRLPSQKGWELRELTVELQAQQDRGDRVAIKSLRLVKVPNQ
ncbi:MAG: type II secretion system protein [Deltaproteobacteria bacterium]|nr:type II secretion system protein [Deltaproteobacteria bacterium]